MTNLRWLKKDGQMVLQSKEINTLAWQDVPTVEEMRKPMEYWLSMVSFAASTSIERPSAAWIKVREVFE